MNIFSECKCDACHAIGEGKGSCLENAKGKDYCNECIELSKKEIDNNGHWNVLINK